MIVCVSGLSSHKLHMRDTATVASQEKPLATILFYFAKSTGFQVFSNSLRNFLSKVTDCLMAAMKQHPYLGKYFISLCSAPPADHGIQAEQNMLNPGQ